MFIDDARILHGHFPTAKLDELAAQALVGGVKWSAFQHTERAAKLTIRSGASMLRQSDAPQRAWDSSRNADFSVGETCCLKTAARTSSIRFGVARPRSAYLPADPGLSHFKLPDDRP